MGKTLINVDEVNKIFLFCLFTDEEEYIKAKENGNITMVNGININVGFNKEKVKIYEQEISNILDNLHPTFKEGWSFLNLCLDKNSSEWTSLHKDMQELLLLGLAIDKLEFCIADKEFWKLMPGNMPYIRVR